VCTAKLHGSVDDVAEEVEALRAAEHRRASIRIVIKAAG